MRLLSCVDRSGTIKFEYNEFVHPVTLEVQKFASVFKKFSIMQRSEEIRSPLGTRAGNTLYDKLNLLAAEISEGVVNLSHGNRWVVEGELRRLKEEADGEVSPEAVYNILLFRKYAGIANQIQDRTVELEAQVVSLSNSSLLDVGNGNVDGRGEAKLVGFEALKTNLFWLRVLAAMFSFISFVVMSTVPGITYAAYNPGRYKGYAEYRCYDVESGTFNMRPYQFVIVTGVLIYLHTLVTSLYYVLPVDDNNEKYIPGLRSCISCLLNDAQHEEDVISSLGSCARMFSRVLECIVDFLLVTLSIVAFLIAVISVDRPAPFHAYNGSAVTYYSMESFYDTYSHRSGGCVTEDDAVGKIRASLAMLFFAVVVMFLCLQVSWRAVKQEFTHRTPPSGHTASDIGSRGVHTFEGREAFLAQALPTSEEENDDYDEEVAVEFHSSPVRATAPAEHQGSGGGGARFMRNHEPQRFASSTQGPDKDTHGTPMDRAVESLESGERKSEEEWEEADI